MENFGLSIYILSSEKELNFDSHKVILAFLKLQAR